MRVTARFLASLDGWRRRQEDLPPRAAAIRRLVALGLAAEAALPALLDRLETIPAAHSDADVVRLAQQLRAALPVAAIGESDD